MNSVHNSLRSICSHDWKSFGVEPVSLRIARYDASGRFSVHTIRLLGKCGPGKGCSYSEERWKVLTAYQMTKGYLLRECFQTEGRFYKAHGPRLIWSYLRHVNAFGSLGSYLDFDMRKNVSDSLGLNKGISSLSSPNVGVPTAKTLLGYLSKGDK